MVAVVVVKIWGNAIEQMLRSPEKDVIIQSKNTEIKPKQETSHSF